MRPVTIYNGEVEVHGAPATTNSGSASSSASSSPDGRVVTHGAPDEQVQEQGFTAGLSTPQATPMLLTGECVACGENWLKDGMREHPCGDPKVSVPKLMARLATAEAERDRLTAALILAHRSVLDLEGKAQGCNCYVCQWPPTPGDTP